MPTAGPSESPIARRANAPSLSPKPAALLVMILVASVDIFDELRQTKREGRFLTWHYSGMQHKHNRFEPDAFKL